MKYIRYFYPICFLNLTVFGPQTKNIYDTEADQHIGQICSVSAIVNTYEKEKHSKRFLLFCGTNYPQRYFTVIIKKGNGTLPTMRAKGNFKGWHVSVTGRVIKYNNMPAILIDDWEDITTWLSVDSTPPADI